MPIPIDRPGKIICVGLNYRDHAEETGQPIPERPILFAKWPNVLIGPGEAIEIPASVSTKVDYEAELGVVIGERVKGASVENALEAVRGYVCFNDVTARDLQGIDGQWSRGKSPDTFGPVGPLVPRERVPDPQSLRIGCLVNGERMQDSTTANMIFSVAEVIAFITQAITLEPGDLIATGTPPGVGFVRKPAVYLKPGDEVTVEIEGFEPLTNPVR